jgi:Tol biopolymer transport system component
MKRTLGAMIVFISILLFFSISASELAANGPNDMIPLDGRGGGVIAYSVTYANNTNKIFLMNADGSRIVYQSKRDGNFEIYAMQADGSDLIRLTNNLADDDQDGRRMAAKSRSVRCGTATTKST